MKDPRKTLVAQGYDSLAEEYLAWASAFADPARQRMLGEFSARLAAGSRVLDLGCGPGVPATQMLASRFNVTGVDISEAQLQAARRNVPAASFLQADLAQIDFPAGSFDGVSALYSISHVPREEHGPLFERMARWLVPGGLLLATLGSGDSPDWIGDWLGRQMFFSSHDADTNRRLLKAANFELLIDEVLDTPEPEGPVPFLWIVARRGPEGGGWSNDVRVVRCAPRSVHGDGSGDGLSQLSVARTRVGTDPYGATTSVT
jgi:ubiquinone/menaquinone biosynthesis C-methylase UbiE